MKKQLDELESRIGFEIDSDELDSILESESEIRERISDLGILIEYNSHPDDLYDLYNYVIDRIYTANKCIKYAMEELAEVNERMDSIKRRKIEIEDEILTWKNELEDFEWIKASLDYRFGK